MSVPNRVVVIAEAGINHGGKSSTAKDMAVQAKLAGADIVKYQTYHTSKILRSTDPSWSVLHALELSQAQWRELAKHCEELGIEFLTTPGDVDSLKFAVEELGLKRIKIGSDDLTNQALVKAAHATGLPLILSTGIATAQDICDAVQEINNYSLLHCISLYPCPPHKVNLRSISYLQETFSCKVGYSDHTGDSLVIDAAVAAGAEIIELHFKLRGTQPIDNAVSLDHEWLHHRISRIRYLEDILGSYDKKCVLTEDELAPLRKGPDGLRGAA